MLHSLPDGTLKAIVSVGQGLAVLGALIGFAVAFSALASAELTRRSDAALASAVHDAGAANREAGAANVAAASARERTEQLLQENLRTRERLELERKERLALEVKVAPRRLTAEQDARLVEALRALKIPRLAVLFFGNGEPVTYSRQIASAVKRAGIECETGTTMLESAFGVTVYRDRLGRWEGVKKAFAKAGVHIYDQEPEHAGDDPALIVGAKED